MSCFDSKTAHCNLKKEVVREEPTEFLLSAKTNQQEEVLYRRYTRFQYHQHYRRSHHSFGEEEARNQVERLKSIIPRQQFPFKIQGKALGRIIAAESVSAFRKDVLMHGSKVVGGGDVSRKKKLLENFI